MPFFRTHLGFDCPLRKGVADFLQEIALPSDQQARWEMAMDGWPQTRATCIHAARRSSLSMATLARQCTPVVCALKAYRSSASLKPSWLSNPLACTQKYWADNTRAYRYVTAQTIRQTFWEVGYAAPAG